MKKVTITPLYQVSGADYQRVREIFDEHTSFLNEWDLNLLRGTLQVIYDGNTVVGYFNPHRGGIHGYEEYYKATPLKIGRKFMNRGYASATLSELYSKYPGLVYIANENFASLAVHRKIGFSLLLDDSVNTEYVLESGAYYIKKL